MSGVRVPKPLTVYLHRCRNTECINNRDDGTRCKWGIQFSVPYCGQYNREECNGCDQHDSHGCVQAFSGLPCVLDESHNSKQESIESQQVGKETE